MGHMAAVAIYPLSSPVVAGSLSDLPAALVRDPALVADSRSIDPTLAHALVADAVRDVLRDADRAAAAGESAPDGGVGSSLDGASPAALDGAVIAAHEQRIALLRDRLTELCSTPAPSPVLAALRERLRRAEAARSLAIARAGGDQANDRRVAFIDIGGCATSRTVPSRSDDRRPRDRGGAVTTIASRRWLAPVASPPRVAPIMVSFRHHRRTMTLDHRWTGRISVVAMSGSRYRLHWLNHRTVIAEANHARHRSHRVVEQKVASRLAHARRALAAARRLLTEPAVASAAVHSPVFVNLWRWDGSETWLLTPGHRTTS